MTASYPIKSKSVPSISLLNQISIPAYFCFIIFLLDLFFFRLIDVYHKHFFSSGKIMVVYHFARLIYIPSLLWIMYFSGHKFINYIYKKNEIAYDIERYITALFIGIGLWQIGLFALGLFGFYQYFIISSFAIMLFISSLPHLSATLQSLKLNKLIYFLPHIAFLTAPIFLFLMIKGLYPAGGHDYYLHYFQYYRKVIDTGSTLPNEVWYHFFYSKGAGLFFISMLLTDPLAPQLVSTGLIFAGAFLIFLILRMGSTWRVLPWLGAATFILFYIYTPGTYQSLQNGGWGDLEKLHEPAAIFILAMLCSTIKIIQSQNLKLWGPTLLFSTISLVLFNPTAIVIPTVYCFLVFLYLFFQKKYIQALWCLSSNIVAGSSLLLMLIINYFYTGIPNDQGLFTFWPVINFDTVRSWGVMFELIIEHWGITGLIANQVPVTPQIIFHIASYLRIDVWGFPLSAALILVFSCLFFKKWRVYVFNSYQNSAFFALALFLFVVCCISFFIGKDQPISYYRFTTFTYGPMLCLTLLLLDGVLPKLSKWLIAPLLIVTLQYGFAFSNTLLSNFPLGKHKFATLNYKAQETQANFSHQLHLIFKNAKTFVLGRYSLKEAYQNQQGWPGRMPWGGIYPPFESILSKLPPKTRIWSMHIHSYCMLPDCHVEGYPSFRLTSHPEIVFYGQPQEIKSIFQMEGLNFFFISTSLNLTDGLAKTPLFDPKEIANYLGVFWTDGSNSLLTWKENAKEPISAEWLAKYADLVDQTIAIKAFPYDVLKPVLIAAQKPRSTIIQKDLPWYHAGWK